MTGDASDGPVQFAWRREKPNDAVEHWDQPLEGCTWYRKPAGVSSSGYLYRFEGPEASSLWGQASAYSAFGGVPAELLDYASAASASGAASGSGSGASLSSAMATETPSAAPAKATQVASLGASPSPHGIVPSPHGIAPLPLGIAPHGIGMPASPFDLFGSGSGFASSGNVGSLPSGSGAASAASAASAAGAASADRTIGLAAGDSRHRYHLFMWVDDVQEIPIGQFAISHDMYGRILETYQGQIAATRGRDYGSPTSPPKLAGVQRDFDNWGRDPDSGSITPLSVGKDGALLRIVDGRHRFIWYVNHGFDKVPCSRS